MNKPIRVQRKRTKGFKLPENTICVTRGTKWGNPFKVGSPCSSVEDGPTTSLLTAEEAKNMYYWKIKGTGMEQLAKQELKGKNLACFCKVGEPCHADVLLEIANS